MVEMSIAAPYPPGIVAAGARVLNEPCVSTPDAPRAGLFSALTRSSRGATMPWATHLLVVASRTAESDALASYLRQRADAGPLRLTLVVPLEAGGRDVGRQRLDAALAGLRA